MIKNNRAILFIFVVILWISACQPSPTVPPSPTAFPSPPTTTQTAMATPAATATATPTPTATLTRTPSPSPTVLSTVTPPPSPIPFPTSPATVRELPAPPLSLAVDPFDQLGIYALLTNNTFYHTVDGGVTWRKMPLPAPERPLSSQAIPARLNALPVWPQRDLVVTRVWPNHIFLRIDQTLYRRSEGENAWAPVLDRVNAWAVDEAEGRLIYAWRLGERTQADPGGKRTHGLYKSEDGGKSWTHVYEGFFPPPLKGQDVPGSHEGIASLAIDHGMPDVLYAGADDGLYRSLNGGYTWARFEEGLPKTAHAYRPVLLLAGGLGSGPVYALTEVVPEKGGNGAQAILARLERGPISPDGDGWRVIGSDVLQMLASAPHGFWGVHTLAVDPDQPNRLYLGNEEGLWRSKDGGETWMPADLGGGMDPVPHGAVYRIAVRSGQETELVLWSDTSLTVHALSTPMIPSEAISHEVQFEVVGQVGGQSRAVAATSSTIYLGIGPRIAGLGNTLPLASLADFGFTPPLPGLVNDMVVDEENSIAYVAAGEAGLLIVDISTVSIARVLGQVETRYEAQAVAVREGLAIVAEGHPGGKGGVSIVDVAIPEMPWQVAYYRLPGPARGAALAEGYAYLVYENGLTVLDLSGVLDPQNPTQPVETARIPLPQCGADVVVEGGHAYVAADGLRVYDLSDPAQPRQVGQFKSFFCASALAVQDDRAYLTDVFCEFGSCGSTLHIVDVSDPARPTEVDTWLSQSAVEDVAVYNQVVYLASWQKGVEAVDVAGIVHPRNPADPRFLNAYGTLGLVTDVVVDGGFAYVSDGALSGLRVLDLATSPRGRVWPKVRGTAGMRWAGGYTVTHGLAYVPVWNEGIRIVDVRDPDAPQELSVQDIGMAVQAVVSGNLAYVSVYDGLVVLDVPAMFDSHEPTAPHVRSKMALSGEAIGLAVREGAAYVAVAGVNGSEKGTLYVIDVWDPDSPKQIGAVGIEGRGLRVTLTGGLACIAVLDWSSMTPKGGVQVVDVSEPAQPRSVAFLALPVGAFDVQVSGQYAFIAGGEAGVYVADLSDPAHLRLVGHMDTPGMARRVSVVGDRVFVADDAGGLLVLELKTVL